MDQIVTVLLLTPGFESIKHILEVVKNKLSLWAHSGSSGKGSTSSLQDVGFGNDVEDFGDLVLGSGRCQYSIERDDEALNNLRELASLKSSGGLSDLDSGFFGREGILDIASAGQAGGRGTVNGAGEEGSAFRHYS